MFEVIEFDDGEYGIRNTWTDQILAEHGVILSFKKRERAEKRANKIAKRLNRQIRKLEKKKGKIL